MGLHRPKGWEREWLVDFANTETFTRGYLWGFTLVGIWPLFLACGLQFFTVGEFSACTVIGAIGLAGTAFSVRQLRPVIAEARRSYREAHANDRDQRAKDVPT